MVDVKEAASSWSSGKDSCLSVYKAMQMGYEIKYLLNFTSGEYKRVTFHGARQELVGLQADALGIQLLQRETTKTNYEEIFRASMRELKGLGITQLVRGDIYLQELQDWVETVCGGEGIKVISPIWHKPTEELLREFVSLGFKSVITSTQADKLGEGWVGRLIDENFIEEIKKVKDVDICGEMGEYHSFVFDGPIFKNRIEILETEKVKRDNYWFIDIKKYKVIPKGSI